MSRRRAPTAFRKPISRVRSVTDTSMMFMMPMPPTTSEMTAIDASSADIVLARRREHLLELGQVADRESVILVLPAGPGAAGT